MPRPSLSWCTRGPVRCWTIWSSAPITGRSVLRSVPIREVVDELPAAFLGRATHAFGAVQLLHKAALPDAALLMRLITELLIELAYIYLRARSMRRGQYIQSSISDPLCRSVT